MDVTLHITLPTFHFVLFQRRRKMPKHTHISFTHALKGETRKSISVNKRIVNDSREEENE